MFLTVATYDNLLRSGRVSRGKAWLAGMLDVKPILSLDGEGRVVATDRARGGDQVLARILARLAGLLSAGPRAVRFGVAHADAPDTAAKVRDALVARFLPRDCLVSLATGVLATHTGPGAWAVFYQIEDGTPTHPARVDG
jgi:DegV family protein with EDD domain